MNKVEKILYKYFLDIELDSDARNFAALCETLGFDALSKQMIEQLNDNKEDRKQKIMETARNNF